MSILTKDKYNLQYMNKKTNNLGCQLTNIYLIRLKYQ